MQRLVLYHAVSDTSHLYLPWRAARDAPAHATRPRTRETAHARTRARSTLLADAARLLKSIRGNARPPSHVHKSLRGTRGTRSPKDGTAPHSGPKGYGQLSSHGSRLPTAPIRGTKPGHIRVVRTTTWDVVPRRGGVRIDGTCDYISSVGLQLGKGHRPVQSRSRPPTTTSYGSSHGSRPPTTTSATPDGEIDEEGGE